MVSVLLTGPESRVWESPVGHLARSTCALNIYKCGLRVRSSSHPWATRNKLVLCTQKLLIQSGVTGVTDPGTEH